MERVRASIVVYKADPELLKKAMESFLSSPMAGLLTILDNSPSNELEKVCERNGVHYFFNGKNLGYGTAHNLAMTESLNKSEYHLVLNPDVCFKPCVIEQLVHFMDFHTRAGLVMPRVVNSEGKVQMLCKLLPTPFNLALRRFFPFESWFQNLNSKYEMSETGYDQVMNVPFLSGCFMFFRTEALQKVGLFDEQFFLYAEDTDLSRRMHAQYDTLYFPNVEIQHIHARGSYKDFNLTIQNIKSAFQYFNKWGWFLDEERQW